MKLNAMVVRHLEQGGHLETVKQFAKTSEGFIVQAYRERIIDENGRPIATLPASFRMHK